MIALRWRMAALAFLAQNVGLGMVLSSFGILLPRICEDLGASRAAAAVAVSIFMMMFGLVSPLVGLGLARFPLRLFMSGGAALCAIAMAAAAFATDIRWLVLLYAIVGIGSGFLGIVAPMTLISRWFDRKRGSVLGIATAPIFMFLSPPAAAMLLKLGGLEAAFLAMAGTFAAVALLMLMVVERPKGQAEAAAPQDQPPAPDRATFLRQPAFWTLTLGIALMAGSGTALYAHGVVYMIQKGIGADGATIAFTIFAGGGVIGTSLFGWLADRITPIRALIIDALAQFALWSCLVLVTDLAALILVCAMIGIGLPALNALQAAALAALFGVRSVPGAIGISYFIKVPFLLIAAPAVGHMFDITQSYDAAFGTLAALMLVSLILFATVPFLHRPVEVR
ncbi:MFS transporter [Rhizorhabdus dicambivorans]|nr:MFS transporter [Rhizorhabdus dicambivorans]